MKKEKAKPKRVTEQTPGTQIAMSAKEVVTQGVQPGSAGTKRLASEPPENGAEMTGIRRTKGGELLLEVKARKGGFKLQGAVAEALKDKADVKALASARTLEVKDLDETVTIDEVLAAVTKALGVPVNQATKCQLRAGFGQTQ